MPKDPKHILESQKQRKKIKERISKYVPGKVTLQVLGTGAKGAPRALYVFTDQSRCELLKVNETVFDKLLLLLGIYLTVEKEPRDLLMNTR